MNVEFVNTLEGKVPQYRLGDAVFFRHADSGKRAFNAVLTNPELFTGTILHTYATRIDRESTDPQWHILKDVVAEKTREIGLVPPREDELVVHLRMGDEKGFKLSPEVFVNYMDNIVTQERYTLDRITIVTALHYGKVRLTKMGEEEVRSVTRREIHKVRAMVDLLSERGISTRIYSHQQIDLDFCYLANSRYLVLGNGHFSLCAAQISDALCAVPPWVRLPKN